MLDLKRVLLDLESLPEKRALWDHDHIRVVTCLPASITQSALLSRQRDVIVE